MAAERRLTLTVNEAAQLMGVSPRSMYRFVNEPDFPVIRVGQSGRKMVIPRMKFLEWLDTKAMQPEKV